MYAGTLGFTADTTSLSAHSVISFYDASAGKTIVQVDTDGNASTVELQIQLTGNIALTRGLFASGLTSWRQECEPTRMGRRCLHRL